MTSARAGLTSAWWAGTAAWVVVATQGPGSPADVDGVISAATIAGVDVDARVHTYVLALLAFLVVGALGLLCAPRLARACGDPDADAFEDSALVGLLLLVLAALTSAQTDAMGLYVALYAAFVVVRWLDARVFRRDLHPRPAAAFLAIAAGSHALVLATPARGDAWRAAGAAAALAVGVHVVLQLVARARDARTSTDRVLAALAGAAWVPFAWFVREEFRLGGAGDAWSTLLAGLVPVSAALVGARAFGRGERLDVERVLSRVVLPGAFLGLSCAASWVVEREPMREMFEGGNAGLSIQQWFEYGRWPFFETWSVHGLSDAGAGFAYAAAHGWTGTTWQHWDFVPHALAVLAAYALLARVLGSAPIAFVVVVASPFAKVLFPPLVAVALVFAFVAVAAARARRARGLVACTLAWIAFTLWRVDLGLAALCAAVVTFVVARALGPAWRAGTTWARPRTAFVAVGATLCACALAYVAVASARGVGLRARLADALDVLGSNAAFGRVDVAPRLDAAVALRLFAVPALVVAVLVALVRAARTCGETAATTPNLDAASEGRRRATFASLALVFLGVFGLLIAPRGLVRHTFAENEGDYVTAFGLAVLACAPAAFDWLRGGAVRRVTWGACLALQVVLPLALRVQQAPRQDGGVRGNLFARAAHRFESLQPVAGDAGTVERSPVPEDFRRNTIEPLRVLRERWLAPDETFLDLSGAPLAYVYAGVRSPHPWNHLLALTGDRAQRRLAADPTPWSAPLCLVRQDAAAAAAAGMRADVEVDGVPLEAWHSYWFANRVHPDYRPFRTAGRWDVWARTDWAAPADAAPLARVQAVETQPDARPVSLDAATGETVVVRLDGSGASGGRVRLSWTRREGTRELSESRSIAWRPDWSERDVVVCGAGGAYRVENLRVHVESPLALRRAQVGITRDPACAAVGAHAAAALTTELGRAAAAFGREFEPLGPELFAYRGVPLPLRDGPAVPVAEAEPGERLRIPLALAFPAGAPAALVVLDLEADGAGTTRVSFTYGDADGSAGTFHLALARGAAERVVLRPGLQAAWHLRPPTWIEVASDGVPFRVRHAALVRDREARDGH